MGGGLRWNNSLRLYIHTRYSIFDAMALFDLWYV